MKALSDAELNNKINTFLTKKFAEHPELRQDDGVKAGKLWHIEPFSKRTWRLIDGHRA